MACSSWAERAAQVETSYWPARLRTSGSNRLSAAADATIEFRIGPEEFAHLEKCAPELEVPEPRVEHSVGVAENRDSAARILSERGTSFRSEAATSRPQSGQFMMVQAIVGPFGGKASQRLKKVSIRQTSRAEANESVNGLNCSAKSVEGSNNAWKPAACPQ
jgi:hypothetical protein